MTLSETRHSTSSLEGHEQTTVANMNQEEMGMEMILTRVFDASLEQVWNAWSRTEDVLRWWGPTAFTCPLARMDFREGGISLVCMRAPPEYGGRDMYNTWTYQRITPMERIEFVHQFADNSGNTLEPAALGLPPGIPDVVRHVITFRALGAQNTELTVTEYGYANEQIVEQSRAGMAQCLDKMAAIFDAPPARSS
jgi:uncharacterized protein YndB with AHSA1/START domain